MNGLQHITETFHATQTKGRAALMPYFTLGFPEPSTSQAILESISRSGADLIELGIPFSDPLADGPTIQRSTQAALRAGMDVGRCLEIANGLRASGVHQPLILMSYINPILAYGVDRFVASAAAARVDGLIVPDLPYEEAGPLDTACREQGMALVYLLAPNSPPARIAALAERASGFLYLVSLTGVTGARSALSTELEDFVARVRSFTSLPLAVGFGISTPEQARQVGCFADGVIVGSALIQAVDGAADPCAAASGFMYRLRAALNGTE